MMADIDADGQWMTYDELAETRGIDRQSARRLASRLKWRRQEDNRQTIRVLVPLAHAEPRNKSADKTADISADISIMVKPLEAAVSTLREQLTASNARGDRLEAEVKKLTTEVGELRSRADRAEGVAEGLKAATASRPSGVSAWLRKVYEAFRS